MEKGVEGGKQAAYALRNAILKECHDYTGEIEVVARFVANLPGLALTMRANGIVERETTVKEFTLGFSQGMASFDFIDVGYGKERADTKIKGKHPPGLDRLRTELCDFADLGVYRGHKMASPEP